MKKGRILAAVADAHVKDAGSLEPQATALAKHILKLDCTQK